MIESAATIALGILAAAAALFLVRMATVRSLADRMVALDAALIAIVCGIAVNTARTGEDTYLNVMVVTALLAFVGTALVARYISRRGI